MRSAETNDTVVIIGGGISGLSSAFYLQEGARKSGKSLKIVLIEGADELGGKINTLRKDGFVIEKGPDSFLSRKRPIIDLAHELGMEHELVATNPEAKKTYIMSGHELYPMPPGLVLGIPTQIAPFLQSELISPKGKVQALGDLFKPAAPADGDESLGQFLERRVGKEMVVKIAEPLLAGIYAGDLKKLSLQATFPQFAAAEKQFGSLIRGMRVNQKAAASSSVEQPKSTFMTFRNGLSSLVEALKQKLGEVESKLSTKVTGIEKTTNGYLVMLNHGEPVQAKAVIITTPGFVSHQLLSPYVNTSALSNINYVSVANVVMAFDKKEFGKEFDGSGFLVPRSEGLHITACTWTSTKWLHTSPEDKVLLRCYVGHSEDQQSVKLNDEQIIQAVRNDIKIAIGITAEPLFTEITRLDHSMPQYPVGHVEATKALRDEMANTLPGVWVTGAAFDGVGLPDCIRQGKEAASQILKYID